MSIHPSLAAGAFGLGAAVVTAFLSSALPWWLGAFLTGLAAILPVIGFHYLHTQRPLHALSARIQTHQTSGKLHRLECAESPSQHPDLQIIAKALTELQKDLAQSISGIATRSGDLAISSAELSHAADMLKGGIEKQVGNARVIGETSQQIHGTTQSMAAIAGDAEQAARATRDASQQGERSVRRTIEQVHKLRSEAERTAETLGDLQSRSQEIQGITQIIDLVAEQTNLLALNAAIEAARAGEHGRGFAVVADEVRQLASKTSAATREIGEKLSTINAVVDRSSGNMEELVSVVESTVTDAEEAVSVLQNIFELSQQSNQGVADIAQLVDSHVIAINDISSALSNVEGALTHTEQEVEDVSRGALHLSDTAESEYEAIARFELDTVHDQMRHIAENAAQRISALFESAIESGQVTLNDLMDRNYQPIANSNPEKFATRFDQFTDQVLPDIQEPILDAHPEIIYAGAVDNNGYFPTHNRRFSQPLTGNYETDLANNRTKRIFNDRTGARCGSSQAPFLLQTYKRDTGEIMHDMSAPITVQGMHWGGFRIGYHSQQH